MNRVATIEAVAVNAVMAGCRPSDFPVLLAAVEAVADPQFNAEGVNTTTNPVVPLLIVNGPVRHTLGINCSYGLFGAFHRANVTIGRALSLCMINIAGRIPGEVSKGTYKMAGELSLCAGEFEEESPWEPLHVERGLAASDSAITATIASGSNSIVNIHTKTGEELARYIATAMSAFGNSHFYTFGMELWLMVSPPHAAILGERYRTKGELKEALHELARIPEAQFSPTDLWHMETASNARALHKDGRGYWLAASPEDFNIFVAGGLGGNQSCFFSTFHSHSITKKIQ
jgi:hypothetical protein